jgi:hypothetical protein
MNNHVAGTGNSQRKNDQQQVSYLSAGGKAANNQKIIY